MMRKKSFKYFFLALALFLFISCGKTNSVEDRVTVVSKQSFSETIGKLRTVLAAENIAVFAEIDHSGEAEKNGFQLRPTRVFIVGNPKAGTPLMQENQIVAIHLPLKILVAENENGETTVTYLKISPIAENLGLKNGKQAAKNIDSKMEKILKQMAK